MKEFKECMITVLPVTGINHGLDHVSGCDTIAFVLDYVVVVRTGFILVTITSVSHLHHNPVLGGDHLVEGFRVYVQTVK